MFKNLVAAAQDAASEFKQFEQLMAPENKELRQLMFYAESAIFYRYYEDYIEYILANSGLTICYVTSESSDPIFDQARSNSRIKPFFIKNLLPTLLAKLDSKVLVLSTPDLSNGFIKRAPKPVHHVYAFRGISSTHQGYKLGAFDNYDSVLCVGQYQIDEIRKTEQIYNLPAKELVLTGYPLVERIYREHRVYRSASSRTKEKQVCLIAPSWAPVLPESSIMDNCVFPLIDALSNSNFEVWIRPHPEFAKRFPEKMKRIRESLVARPNISLQTELSSMQCLHEADILVTDHSSIAVDFFLGTERPVVFVNTPRRVDNPESGKLALEPVENVIRTKMGGCVEPDKVSEIVSLLRGLLSDRSEFQKRVPEIRDQLVANWQRAAEVGGCHILRLCAEQRE